MPTIDINDIGQVGVVRDVPGYMLPPEAWTTALNVISRDGAMEALKGWEQVFGTPNIAPHFAMAVTSPAQTFWLYTSLTNASVWDGSTHTDITRAAGVYSAGAGRNWNGTLFGGIPILNNGVDVPQYWPDYSIVTDLADMTNWPVGAVAKRVIAFGAYLFGLNWTISGSNYPHLMKWSSQANGPGQLPSSWDESDPAEDAGEYDLPDVNSGVLQDALTLGTKLFAYKDQSIWQIRFVGGRAVFAFDNFSETAGILAPRCVSITGDGKKHVLATQDDIVIHDGSASPVSIVDKRMRRKIFNDMDVTNYVNSFMFTDPENNLVVFCYPTSGSEFPNMALLFNYKDGALTEMDGVSFRHAAVGRVESADTETWASASGTWDTDIAPWNLSERRKLVLSAPAATKLHKWYSSYQRDTVDYAVQLQRTGLSIVGKKRGGEPIVNHEIYKFVDRMWPKIRTVGAIQIRIGFQDTVDGTITWGSYFSFTPSTDVTADFVGSGRAVAVEFYLPTAKEMKLDGYRLNVTPDGNF